MRVTVVGSGTVVPRLDRRQSCVVVNCGGETIALDLGAGAIHGMLHAGLDPFSLDRIFFTHLHPDHTSELIPLLFSTNYSDPANPRERPLMLAGPEGFAKFWDLIGQAYNGWLSGDYQATLELPVQHSEQREFGGYHLSWAPAQHRPESIAYRIEEPGGESLVYTGDTEYSESVVDLARGAHTMIVECSFPDDSPVPGHLTPKGVAGMAREAGVSRVVLTHIFPPADELDLVSEVGRGYAGEVIVASDGLELTL
ncbi:MBL fold metallo-hydrolase [Rubrobacter aplysinae]|uniref:MBL fold metallo-hydrolase n=1 Tax=Rubrobacter aplysinae TaxID=909625 RepID=UPI00064BCCAC|nr:ribonuclease Z [Rubrobacter aplysinae]